MKATEIKKTLLQQMEHYLTGLISKEDYALWCGIKKVDSLFSRIS